MLHAYPPADAGEAETEHSNIDSGVKKLVNVFWTQVVLIFVSLMGNFLGCGAERHQQEEQVFFVTVLMQDSRCFLQMGD